MKPWNNFFERSTSLGYEMKNGEQELALPVTLYGAIQIRLNGYLSDRSISRFTYNLVKWTPESNTVLCFKLLVVTIDE